MKQTIKLRSTLGTAALATGLLFTSGSVLAAEGLKYGYIEGGYVNLDVDEPNENDFFDRDFDNGNGYGLKASIPFGERFFVYGEYSDTESDFAFTDNTNMVVPGNTDILKFNLGVGVVLPMSERSDVVVSGGYSDIDYNDFNFGGTSSSSIDDLDDDSSDGFTIDAMLRSQLTDRIETTAGARYTDIQDLDGLSFIGSVMYEMTENWGLNLSVDAGDDLVTWGAGVRYSF